MNDAPPSPASAEGHRERMRTRFLAGDESALSDEALLELLLSYAIPRRDVRPLAQALVAHFGSIASVLAADPADLKRIRECHR
jgi:DNA repair protein RadC